MMSDDVWASFKLSSLKEGVHVVVHALGARPAMSFTRDMMKSRRAYIAGFPDATPIPWPRALQPSESVTASTSSSMPSSTPTTTSTKAATTTRPFFQDPSSVTPVPDPDKGSPLPKVVLQYVLIAAFVTICVGLILHRIMYRRRHNVSFWPSFRQTPSDVPSSTHRFPRTTGFTEVPPYPYAQRTRAFDTDAAGRRIGIEVSDHDGYIGDKDVLPAYDNAGRPPKYREMAHELDVMPSRSVDVENTGSQERVVAERPETLSQPLSVDDNAAAGPQPLTTPPAVHVRQ